MAASVRETRAVGYTHHFTAQLIETRQLPS